MTARLASHGARIAIVDRNGPHPYCDLDAAATRVAGALLSGASGLDSARVAFRVRPGFDFAAVLCGIWRAGGIAVPLALSHPKPELEFVVRDAGAAIVVTDESAGGECLPELAAARGARLHSAAALVSGGGTPDDPIADHPMFDAGQPALILYTSGTTGRPKGVVLTHANLDAQIASLTEAWAWTGGDRILLVLPMHHVHGLVNVVCCALANGATCEMPDRFDIAATWSRLVAGDLTLFMAVPTIYYRLLQAFDAASDEQQQAWSGGSASLRLMVSGSAALPVQTLGRWQRATGHTLLERYGMTEIGMALSQPLTGTRRPGTVGQPLPGVGVRLVDEQGRDAPAGETGEIEVRGATVFGGYWQRPAETQAAFRDGWFRTGDVAVIEDDAYRILGRSSTDIIKTGGYKVSALEIEERLRLHPAIAECAVVGLPDPAWGERVAAAVELRSGADLTLAELQQWAGEHLAPYKIPRALRCVSALPRNAMGKVIKPEVATLFGEAGPRG